MPTADDSARTGAAWLRDAPQIAGATDVGVVRAVNQDAFGHFEDAQRQEILLVVADGLGGHLGGEVASQLAVETLGQLAFSGAEDPATRLRHAIEHANRQIYEAAHRDPALDGMGTTVVCLLLAESGPSYVGHVGDSRFYRIRERQIEALTEDHSLVATLVRDGLLTEAEAREDPRRHQILRALGVYPETEVDLAPVDLRVGDRVLLCSDGLNGLLTDDEILAISQASERAEDATRSLIAAANDAGGTDNVTVVLARIPESFTPFLESTQTPPIGAGSTSSESASSSQSARDRIDPEP